MYSPRFLRSASRQLERIDPPVARRIVDRIRWLAEHFEEFTPEPLKGDLAGLFKFREGDYRIIYEPLRKERLIVVHEIGHRKDIYKKSKL
ncbi:MAG: type II toxin-antitoxin system RelE/ParE family toxin [Acidobacteria bacterium]|nr:type II toxin-antitoxin system RelE/ParE family toxin [Acidobacteriota bacterium]